MNEKLNSPKSKPSLVDLLAMTLAPLVAAIVITFISLGSRKTLDLNAEVNVTMINGVLTATAVIFAIVTFEIRRVWHSGSPLVSVFLYLPFVVLLTATVNLYFIDAVTVGHATVNTMIWATVSFFFDIFYFVALMFLANYRKIDTEKP